MANATNVSRTGETRGGGRGGGHAVAQWHWKWKGRIKNKAADGELDRRSSRRRRSRETSAGGDGTSGFPLGRSWGRRWHGAGKQGDGSGRPAETKRTAPRRRWQAVRFAEVAPR